MDELGIKLKELIEKEGLEILKNSGRINGILADFFPKEDKLRGAVRDALKIGAGDMFYNLAGYEGSDRQKKIEIIQKRLVDEAWLSDAAAEAVCRIFLMAIGMDWNENDSDENDSEINAGVVNNKDINNTKTDDGIRKSVIKPYIKGTIGALLGGGIGAALAVIFVHWQIGYAAAATGAVTGFCVVMGYKLLAKNMTKQGVVLACCLALAISAFEGFTYIMTLEYNGRSHDYYEAELDTLLYKYLPEITRNKPNYDSVEYPAWIEEYNKINDDVAGKSRDLKNLEAYMVKFISFYALLTVIGTVIGIFMVFRKQKR